MEHAFIAGAIDNKLCARCNRDFIAHSAIARCEACSYMGNCELYPGIFKDSMLLCPTCKKKEIDAEQEVRLNKAKEDDKIAVIKNKQEVWEFALEDALEGKLSVIEKANQIDSSVKFSGDFFNLESVAISDIKREIDKDESLTKEQKNEKLHEFVMLRIERYGEAIRKKDEEKFELVVRQQSAIKNLRSFGNELRKEIRERIRLSDASVPMVEVVKAPKLVKPKLSAFDKLVQTLAAHRGISEDEARTVIEKNKQLGAN